METIEEKARAYDEAIKKAKSLYKASEPMSGCSVILETLFPELAESEDEKIRKWLLDFVQGLPNEGLAFHCYKPTKEQVIVWLEKQAERKTPQWMIDFLDSYRRKIGCCLDHDEARDVEGKILCIMQWLENQDEQEKDILEDAVLDGNEDGLIAETIRYKKEKQAEQNQTDKVKPKFKVGDWIINPRTGLIEHIKNVLLCSNSGNYEFESSSMSIDSVDNSFHLWTIQDAKDGDILANDNEIVIFKENDFNQKDLSGCMFVHCSLHDKKGYWYTIGGINPSNYVPATKEQRDLLFQKMHEAGYEWDARNKVMTKIEQNPADSYCQENCKRFQETGKCFADGECKAKREAEQELTDLNEFINELSKQFPDVSFAKLSRIVVRVAKWAKYNQPKKEWSEEDEKMIESLIESLTRISANTRTDSTSPNYSFYKEIDWLKSLRPQNRWKPSEEQIRCLWHYADQNDYEGTVLTSLYKDLKKLKEV